jgi:hypothetical protein
MRGWIGVDLDGTLARHDGGGVGTIGSPVPLMLARVRAWLAEGHDVRIMTARASGPADLVTEQTALIEAWCEDHLGQALPVTCSKDYAMLALFDDRAVGVVPNTGELVGP